jgi:hypothetical protein
MKEAIITYISFRKRRDLEHKCLSVFDYGFTEYKK